MAVSWNRWLVCVGCGSTTLTVSKTTGQPLTYLPLIGPFGSAEQLTSVGAWTDNEMFGGQLGFRYFKFRDRFTFSSDFKAFFGGNWQCSTSQTSVYTAIYDLNANAVTIGDPPIQQTIARQQTDLLTQRRVLCRL